jgi:hypothetical protein
VIYTVSGMANHIIAGIEKIFRVSLDLVDTLFGSAKDLKCECGMPCCQTIAGIRGYGGTGSMEDILTDVDLI